MYTWTLGVNFSRYVALICWPWKKIKKLIIVLMGLFVFCFSVFAQMSNGQGGGMMGNDWGWGMGSGPGWIVILIIAILIIFSLFFMMKRR
jgi:hypothetical protein